MTTARVAHSAHLQVGDFLIVPTKPLQNGLGAARVSTSTLRQQIEKIIAQAPTSLIEFQAAAARMPLKNRPTMKDWLERFNAGLPEAA
ncbi:hypothetical protein [Sphingomonas xinjiangensis]|uniref:Uncharacterized protein n=1 Tax=Sphingomonas xinjiangensis TaxID=643568 RepID=A0A840YSZ0_9SPHN|nr:hypothetical protein [Sphingomonas xinjiangensis]MBB5712816.1 hypothetical protein [Sphingomonas xinjiangensis]